jgi:MAF protein
MLGLLNLPFDVTRADIDETPHPGEHARDYTARLSREKAQAIAARGTDGDVLILAADTTVADGPEILGKPADADEARLMLRQLRDRTHQVYTAISLLDTATGRALTDVSLTDVTMRAYSDAAMDAYIGSGDPFDKAGGYAIQNTAFHPVAVLRGCYPNVMGLPLCLLAAMLRDFSVEPPPDAPGLCLHPDDPACDLDPDMLNRL